jgi:hypothetical protein
MKITAKKTRDREPDDSLFGLLAAYKVINTYLRVFVNEKKKQITFMMTANPKFFPHTEGSADLEGFRVLKRSELNVTKLSVKYLAPEHILEYTGDTIGLKLTTRNGKIHNRLKDSDKLFTLETSLSQLPALALTIKKIVALSPQKKYEIIERYMVSATKTDVEE